MHETKPNILFIILDTVRADSTTFGDRGITPTIETERRRGKGYQKAIAPTPWSLSSHASMFTGRYATEHGATQDSPWLSDEYTTLAERLSKAKYTTGIFTGNLFTSGAFNMSRGFDTTSFSLYNKLFNDGHCIDEVSFREDYPHKRELLAMAIRELLAGDRKTGANILWSEFDRILGPTPELDDRKELDDHIIPDAKQFIRSKAGSEDPFFAVVNILAAHGPWEYDKSRLQAIGVNPSDYGSHKEWEYLASVSEEQWPYAAGELRFSHREKEMLTLLYESWVHEADKLAGELIQTLVDVCVRDDTVVVLTADHGEAIANDGVLGHTVSLKNDCVHVPLVVSGPEMDTTEVKKPVSLKGLYGTLLSSAGAQTDATSLHDMIKQDMVLTERFGVSPTDIENYVDGMNDKLKSYTHHHRKLYTDTSSIEQCVDTGRTFGDESLLSHLQKFIKNIDRHSQERIEPNLSGRVTNRLEQLGYRDPGN